MESYTPKHSGVAAEQGKRALKEESHPLIQRGYTSKHSGVAAEQWKRALEEGSHPLIQRGYEAAP